MIPEPAGVNGGTLEGMADGEHLDERGGFACVCEVIPVRASGSRWDGLWLRGQELGVALPFQFVSDEGVGKPCEVAAAAYASDDVIGDGVQLLHLEPRFLTDD